MLFGLSQGFLSYDPLAHSPHVAYRGPVWFTLCEGSFIERRQSEVRFCETVGFWKRQKLCIVHTHTHPFNDPLSGTTQVSRYQKGKTNLDFTGARDSEWQWHQLEHMQVCTSLQKITTPAPHYSVFYRPDALPAAQPTASKHWRQVVYSALKLFLETFTVNRFRLRSWLADKHLQSAMKVECSQFSPNIEQMAIKDKCNISHQLLVTAIVFQDMTLVVWNTFPDCFFTSQRCYLCFCFLLFYIFVPVSSHKPLGGEEVPAIFPLVAVQLLNFLSVPFTI